MKKLSIKFQDFGWEKNAGYGTKMHIKIFIVLAQQYIIEKLLNQLSHLSITKDSPVDNSVDEIPFLLKDSFLDD